MAVISRSSKAHGWAMKAYGIAGEGKTYRYAMHTVMSHCRIVIIDTSL
jgi:hypothetical protein